MRTRSLPIRALRFPSLAAIMPRRSRIFPARTRSCASAIRTARIRDAAERAPPEPMPRRGPSESSRRPPPGGVLGFIDRSDLEGHERGWDRLHDVARDHSTHSLPPRRHVAREAVHEAAHRRGLGRFHPLREEP